MTLHGPHQVAQKSMKTGTSDAIYLDRSIAVVKNEHVRIIIKVRRWGSETGNFEGYHQTYYFLELGETRDSFNWHIAETRLLSVGVGGREEKVLWSGKTVDDG